VKLRAQKSDVVRAHRLIMPIRGNRLSSINEDASKPWGELSRCSITARRRLAWHLVSE
jgi:hypothetical protein